MTLFRSVIFNILFFGSTLLACIVLMPGLLFSRETGLNIAKLWLKIVYGLEKTILGLNYEVRGLEHLPDEGSYIVAAKHQSAYETMKLHILFDDPSVVLKKELLSIPLWGQFLKKVDVIAIDRSNREEAMKSLAEGAQRMKDQKRPIIIFPQGTRVRPEATSKDKPYKAGIAKMAKNADLPIIPMALNSGVFWGRNSFLKHSGTVVFEFLPPVSQKQAREDIVAGLEKNLESASIKLMQEAKSKNPALPYTPPKALDAKI